MTAPSVPPVGGSLNVWARQLNAYLMRVRNQLQFKLSGDQPATDGLIMYDQTEGYPVVSKNGVWRQIVLEDGNASLYIDTDQNAAAANTPYALSFSVGTANGINVVGSKIYFDESGEYTISFTAQINCSTSSINNFWFWPRINGVDIAGSTMRNSLKDNGSTLVVARTAIFQVAAGDYLEAMWATDDITGNLKAHAATAFAPAAPAATLAIARVHG